MVITYLNKIVLILLLVCYLNAEQLHGVTDFFKSSQVLYSHCALIPYQKFYPSSCELHFSSKDNNFEFCYASLFAFRNNGFAFGYKRLTNKGNLVAAGYGMNNGKVSFGAGFDIFFKQSAPLLLLNVSSMFEINDYHNIALSVNNIGKLSNEKIFPELFIESGGKLFKNDKYQYNIGLKYINDTNDIKSGTTKFQIDLKKKFLNRPYFILTAGYGGIYEKMITYQHIISVGLGATASFNDNGASLLFGYNYNLSTFENSVLCGIQYNPLEFSDITPPKPSMNITCRNDLKAGYFISLSCADNPGGTGLKSWTLVFTNMPSKEAEIYKIFSGGNTVPSTIYWDLRDKEGRIMDTLDFYSRIVAVDNKNNIGYSPWIKIVRCK